MGKLKKHTGKLRYRLKYVFLFSSISMENKTKKLLALFYLLYFSGIVGEHGGFD